MLQMAPDYDNLTVMQKVEVFEYALDNTPGQDLYRVLWLKSRSSEAWLERRTAYMRSLATSSIAGYILGLGDRHPSNLLMDRRTGEISTLATASRSHATAPSSPKRCPSASPACSSRPWRWAASTAPSR